MILYDYCLMIFYIFFRNIKKIIKYLRNSNVLILFIRDMKLINKQTRL